MAVIIGGPNNPNAYVYQPSSPRDTSKKVKSGSTGSSTPSFNPFTDKPIPVTPKNRRPINDPSDELQFLIEQKDSLKNLPSTRGPDLNAYQDAIQTFRTSSPQAMQAYGQRFPLTQFAMTGLPKIAMSMIPGGNVFSTIANAYQSGKGKVQGGLSSIADEFSGTLAGLKSLLPTSLGGANVPDVSTPIKFIDESRPEDYPLKDMAVDQTPLSNFFKIPMYTQNYPEQQAGPNPTYVDPREIREFLNPNKKFNEGGLASLSNPEYDMLMKASDFSL